MTQVGPTPTPGPDGFGAGFFALALLAVLAGIAVLLGLVAVAGFLARRRSGRVPRVLAYGSVVLLLPVVAIGGFGVLALFDEASVLAGLFAAVVVAPLVVGLGWLRRTGGRSWLFDLAATGHAWSLPYLVGLAAFVGITIGVNEGLGLAPAQSRSLGVGWYAAAGAGILAVAGSVWLAPRVRAAWWSSPESSSPPSGRG